jgi:integrase
VSSISKREDGRWRARYRDSAGREHAKHFERKADATNWLSTMTASIVSGNYIDPRAGRETFHDFGTAWAAAQDWKETTREGVPRAIARVEAVLPKQATLGSIDQLTIKRARIELAKAYAPKTVTLSMSYLLAIMRAAYATGRIGRDPTIGSRSRRRRGDDADRVSADDVPTRAEVAAIWNAAPLRYRAAIALGAAGLRVGEVIGLTVDRIDVDDRTVTVDRQLQRIGNEMAFTTPKGEKARTIKVPSAVALELRRHIREHQGDGLLFRGGRGAEMRRDYFYASAWRPALIAAGLAEDAFVFHSLRHFCASSMLAEGVNPMAVAGHLGDTLETLQRVYAHWMRDDRDVPADALERILLVDSADSSRTARVSAG